jgi:propionyl-CoA carboxylase beta chain
MANDRDAPDDLHSWAPMLDDLDARVKRARAMGGAHKLARTRERGELDARARIDALLDSDSFAELGTLVGGIHGPG